MQPGFAPVVPTPWPCTAQGAQPQGMGPVRAEVTPNRSQTRRAEFDTATRHLVLISTRILCRPRADRRHPSLPPVRPPGTLRSPGTSGDTAGPVLITAPCPRAQPALPARGAGRWGAWAPGSLSPTHDQCRV